MGRPPYILIAEDDADDRFLMASAFKEKGFAVKLSFVHNGQQVLDYLNSIAFDGVLPDLIILDLNMPLLNGPQTLLLLKDHYRYNEIPVIIHSSSDNETDRSHCLQIGADDYRYKGTDYNTVRQSVQYFYDFSQRQGNF
jgi:DNA-binding response OmpR family regulator